MSGLPWKYKTRLLLKRLSQIDLWWNNNGNNNEKSNLLHYGCLPNSNAKAKTTSTNFLGSIKMAGTHTQRINLFINLLFFNRYKFYSSLRCYIKLWVGCMSVLNIRLIHNMFDVRIWETTFWYQKRVSDYRL